MRFTLPTILSTSAILNLSSFIDGSTISNLLFASFKCLTMAGFLYIDRCIAGTTIIGIPAFSPVTTQAVTGLSLIPRTIFDSVFAVHGETRIRSTSLSLPHKDTCSTLPVSERRGLLPDANSMVSG